ncbi:MAG: lipoate--protein ligase family protein [Gemmatimonadota bacterium]
MEAVSAIRLLSDGTQPGVRNMAVDEALMRSAAAAGVVTLRLYRWEPACLSFGRNQEARDAYDAADAAERGIDVVRRPTGGRAVYHHRELTYSVAAPAGTWGSLRETYRRINRALAAGLRELGVPAVCAGDEPDDRGRRRAAPRPTPRACFRDPLPGEVTVGGRKLVGSAQWRDGGAFLQHGSILLVDEQHVVESLRSRGHAVGTPSDPMTATSADAGGISLADLLDELPRPPRLEAALADGFAREFGVELRSGEPTHDETRAATDLEARYADPAWTWRR